MEEESCNLVVEEKDESCRFAELGEIRAPQKMVVEGSSSSWSSAFHARTPRNRQGSPSSSSAAKVSSIFRDSSSSIHGYVRSSRFSNSNGGDFSSSSNLSIIMRSQGFWWSPWMMSLKKKKKKNHSRRGLKKNKKRSRGLVAIVGLVVVFFALNWWMLSHLQQQQDVTIQKKNNKKGLFFLNQTSSSSSFFQGEWRKSARGKRHHKIMYSRLLALAAHAMAEGENKLEPPDLWEEPLLPASAWTPCADQCNWEACGGDNGYILVSANGGISQQRVAVCNAVAVARLLNSTLVIPKFLYSSVWRDESQFSDIYQEEHFIDYLKADIRIVKELPLELQSLDLEAIGSLVTDAEIMKEAKPSFFLKNILPILLRNRVVHFVGFGNRLSFDPIPFQLQKLRCRCNFHALKFVHKIQETGALLVQRMRQHMPRWGPMDHNLFGHFAAKSNRMVKKDPPAEASRYSALHLRFEIDMAAHSMCEFGGGEEEREELEAYRSIHFPTLTLLKNTTIPSASALRSEGWCPLTPEEAVLMLVALGLKRKTRIYLAGAHIYGGKSRMVPLTSLYPNLVTKEDLLSYSEIEPFKNFSSQLAALDFIGCAAADAFAMTDSGSQLSSLVSGYRVYYGGGRMPSIRPNKRRLAGIFSKNSTIEWHEFEDRVRKTVKESKQIQERPVARSIYRHPRCHECMCMKD